jgi:hypothetical protein
VRKVPVTAGDSVQTGASFSAVIVTFTMMESVSVPSDTVTTKLSLRLHQPTACRSLSRR